MAKPKYYSLDRSNTSNVDEELCEFSIAKIYQLIEWR